MSVRLWGYIQTHQTIIYYIAEIQVKENLIQIVMYLRVALTLNIVLIAAIL